jgi:predicted GNAT family N-acyltransferase
MNGVIEPVTVDAVHLEFTVAHAINKLMLETWPHIAQTDVGTTDFLSRRWTHYDGPKELAPQYHLLYFSGEVVALAHSFGRTIARPGSEFVVMGLANVCVARRERGQGYGKVIAQAAFERVNEADFPLALFQTTPQVEPFYRQLGATAVSNRFYNSLAQDAYANPFWDPVVMRYSITSDWNDSDIDILGPAY